VEIEENEMSDVKFTPGPWMTIENRTNTSIATGNYIDGGRQIAFVAGSPTKPFRRANATLIAAAPGMYAALKDIAAKQMCVCKLNPLVDGPVPCETCKLNELIARAEGR
jgi:hypothetical protein